VSACSPCLARSWLLARLAGPLDRARDRILALLALSDADLILALAGRQRSEVRAEHEAFDPRAARARAAGAGTALICRCSDGYPPSLRTLEAPPAVLHVFGDPRRFQQLTSQTSVAVVGARRASPYGLTVAHTLGRGLCVASVTVVSGMALGIDSSAHRGALAAGEDTLAVLAGAADTASPASGRVLHRQIASSGAVVSELPPGTRPRRWMFTARNRIIAGLSAMTVVVEARASSGALLTAATAGELGRPVGAVPGAVTSPLTAGPHGLIRAGAELITGPQDVLDGLFGVGGRPLPPRHPPDLPPHLQRLLDALAEGHELSAALSLAGLAADSGLAALASLELAGRIRRQAGGRFCVMA
jgi:DNA processing protein